MNTLSISLISSVDRAVAFEATLSGVRFSHGALESVGGPRLPRFQRAVGELDNRCGTRGSLALISDRR